MSVMRYGQQRVVTCPERTEVRILLVSEDLPAPAMGGLAHHVLALGQALKKAGHAVDLMGNDDFDISPDSKALLSGSLFFPELRGQFSGWKEIRAGVFMPGKRSLLARRFARAMLRRAADYDVIHYHGHLPNVARYLPANLNFVQTRHDQGSDCLIHTRFRHGEICKDTDPEACASCRTDQPNWFQRQISAIAVRQFRQEVHAGFFLHKTVFVSQLLRRNLARSFGSGTPGITIHNFIDGERIRIVREKIRPLPYTGSLRVFIAAKLYPAKGVSALLAHLSKSGFGHLLIDIAGDGEEESRLRKRYPTVNFHGWQSMEAVLQLAMRAHVIVVPSICEEACPSTVLEGLSLGKTVFALQRGGTPELSVYASRPDQLRLHQTLDDLAEALRCFAPKETTRIAPPVSADVRHAAGKLLALYTLPPGPMSA